MSAVRFQVLVALVALLATQMLSSHAADAPPKNGVAAPPRTTPAIFYVSQ